MLPLADKTLLTFFGGFLRILLNKTPRFAASLLRLLIPAALVVGLPSCSGQKLAEAQQSTAQKDESAGSDDKPDQPASLSGSYLAGQMTCAIHPVNANDLNVEACCYVHDDANKRVKLKTSANSAFKIQPQAGGTVLPPKVETLNLSGFSTHLCHVIYRAKLPAAAAVTSAKKLGLTGTAAATVARNRVIYSFMQGVPVYRGSAAKAAAMVAKAPAKQGSGLALAESAASFKNLVVAAGKTDPAFVNLVRASPSVESTDGAGNVSNAFPIGDSMISNEANIGVNYMPSPADATTNTCCATDQSTAQPSPSESPDNVITSDPGYVEGGEINGTVSESQIDGAVEAINSGSGTTTTEEVPPVVEEVPPPS